MDKHTLGRLGEEAAAVYLKHRGCTLLGKNLRIGRSEVDLLLTDGIYLIFAEVKTRREYPRHTDPYGRPADAVDQKKSACLIRAADDYMNAHPDETKIPRIDVVEIYADPSTEELRVLDTVWIKNAVVRQPKFGRKSRHFSD